MELVEAGSIDNIGMRIRRKPLLIFLSCGPGVLSPAAADLPPHTAGPAGPTLLQIANLTRSGGRCRLRMGEGQRRQERTKRGKILCEHNGRLMGGDTFSAVVRA